MRSSTMSMMLAALVLAPVVRSAAAEVAADSAEVYPAAIFPFQERGAGAKGMGEKVADILFASLVARPELFLVDRQEMDKTLGEHELNLSGMVAPGQAIQVGQLTGARILLTGSVVESDKTIYLVARIIGTETTRVLGESVKGRASDEFAPMVEELAGKIADTIANKGGSLVAKTVKTEDRIAALKDKLGEGKRPTLHIKIAEQHIGRATIDPAAETEMTLFCRETGFTVLEDAAKADILISGEGFSEFAMRRGNLVSVKARVEVKAVDRATGEVLAIDRQTAVEVGLAEQVAAKAALQRAAATIAERMLPQIAGEKIRSEK